MTVRSPRVQSIDIVRGLVMVLMAIDHVRLYGGVPAGGQTPALFFTRWVTNFCAPVFVMFAGTGAYFYGKVINDQSELARFLVTRGLLLVALELTLIRFTWTFNLNWSNFMLAGVIWMLGWCMVGLGGIVFLNFSAKAIGILGLAIVFLQQVFAFGRGSWWEFIYPAGKDAPFGISVLYVIVPWIGVMMAGYGFGQIMASDADTRRRWCLRIGLAATFLFLIVATIIAVVNEPSGLNARVPPLWIRILAQNKYPASQLFLMMTLGPAIALLPLVEGATGVIARVFRTFGRVPMFYYLLHIPLIHIAALAMASLRGDGIHHEWYATAPFASVPPAARWSLGQLYLVWAIVILLLYPLCAWYAKVKTEKPAPWMRYV
jgi:uncharacterized membrane protein